MKRAATLAMVVFLIGVCGQVAYSCGCAAPSDKVNFKKWVKKFNGAAFTGRVVKIETDEENFRNTVTFEVRSIWRGIDGRKAVIQTANNSGMCGVGYEEGKDYLVIADLADGVLRTNSCSNGHYSWDLNGYLSVLGERKLVAEPEGSSPRKTDEFGDVPCNEELARLDQFASELLNDPDAFGVLYVYGGKRGRKRAAKARVARMSYYLEDTKDIDQTRFIAVEAGYRKNFSTEIWIWHPGNSAPTPTPTLSRKKVRFRGKEKVRRYNCAEELGAN